MVTFSLPGENDAAPVTNGTPRARPPLPFATKRAYAASPYGGGASSSRHLGTPQSASSRKILMTRDEVPSSSLSKHSIATARNIFRASSISDSPPPLPNNMPFSPNLPQSAMKRVFAPGATPEPSRVYRESTAHATPRGMAAKTTDKDLFPLRIASPPSHLTGEILAQKVPKEWNSKGSIYADQFLAHLCPPELDEEQRRQFFCILDLRRLKYAANEIFSRKDWKLNVINFAKEFEKSRSIILLRYGLYEFQNVKPSKEVLKRWRREHGLPEPEDEEEDNTPTPTKPTVSKKRKADVDLIKVADNINNNNDGKRRATEKAAAAAQPLAAPIVSTSAVLGKKKRQLSMDEDDRSASSKQQKPAPSASKSLFEKIANKPAVSAAAAAAAAASKPATEPAAKPMLFGANKAASGGNLARSVFENIKSGGLQPPATNGNIFGYLSDASSAKNSGADADADSDDSDEDDVDSPQPTQSDTPTASVAGSEAVSKATISTLFGAKPTTAATNGDVSSPGTRESTPGRSIFDRVTKGDNGEPLRAQKEPEAAPPPAEKTAPADQTWNPSTTPLKFAPPSSLFKPSDSASAGPSASSIFAPKPAAASTSLFGAPKQQDTPATSTTNTDKEGSGSDKENESQPAKKPMFEMKPTAPASSAFGSLFQPKPADTAAKAGTDTTATTTTPSITPSLFGGVPKPPSTNIFGAAAKATAPASTPAPVMQSTTLFTAKPIEAQKPAVAAAPSVGSGTTTPTASFTFGQQPAAPAAATAPAASALAPATSLFGAPPSAAKPSLFGASTAPKTDAPTPTFSFGGTGGSGSSTPGAMTSKPLFGVPKSPPVSAPASSLFAGSPMKQDEQSPAKKVFAGGSNLGAAPLFSFGAPSVSSSSAAPVFGGAVSTTTNNNAAISFGSTTSNGAGSSFGFNFGAGGGGGGGSAGAGSSFNNPFATGTNSNVNGSSAPAAGGFSFTAGSTPSTTPNTSFQFGGNSATNNNAAPVFGGASSVSAPSSFTFGQNTAAVGTAQPVSGGNIFGSNQPVMFGANLQPPIGGSSTTGTNSPLNFAGGSSLATTPAASTPEPSAKAEASTSGSATANAAADDEDGEKHEQINLTDGAEEDEETLHEVRAKVLKFTPASKDDDDDDKPKSKSPWATMGVGPLRLLKHKETNAVRLLLRAEPRGHIAINRILLPNLNYRAEEKYVRLATSNEKGDGLETWMIQVKTKDLAKTLAEALEESKVHNNKD